MKLKLKPKVLAIAAVVLVVLAFATAGSNENPPVEHRVAWDSPRTGELFARACASCHSHETEWPWYTHVAPLAQWVRHHVEEGREHFNISVEDMGDADEAAEEVREGEMPLPAYTWLGMHPEARLTAAEREQLARGLAATFGESESDSDEDSHEDH